MHLVNGLLILSQLLTDIREDNIFNILETSRDRSRKNWPIVTFQELLQVSEAYLIWTLLTGNLRHSCFTAERWVIHHHDIIITTPKNVQLLLNSSNSMLYRVYFISIIISSSLARVSAIVHDTLQELMVHVHKLTFNATVRSF